MVLAKDIQSGEYFRYKGDILRIVRKEVVAVGTHSHSKSKLIVQNLEGGGEKQLVFAHEDKLESVDVIKSKAQVILKTQDSVQIMDLSSYETLNAEINNELLEQLNEEDQVMYVEIDGRFKVVSKLR